MIRPSLLKAAPALAVILALASTSAYGATNVRGGVTSTDKQAATQSAAVQSTQQAGSVQTNSPAEGAARRVRSSGFISKTIEVMQRVVTGKAPVVTSEKEVSESDRKLTAHLADAAAFIRDTATVDYITEHLAASVKVAIFYGANTEEKRAMYALVDELAKTDQQALYTLFVLANSLSADALKKDKPGLTSALGRIESRLRAAGFVQDEKDGTWNVKSSIAPSIFAAPGARALLHLYTDNKTQQATRETLAKQRASILSATKAHQSIERMQILKKYILSVYKESGVQIYYPSQFMNKLHANSGVTANGGVILVFGNTPYPLGISTAHGSIYYAESTYPRSWSRADEYFKKYEKDLGLELVSIQSDTGYKEYAVTRLPDGTRIPKATVVDDAPVSPSEIRELVSDIPERARQGIKVGKD